MRILLIDADSKVPNLALMKLSTYHKNKNDIVDFKKLNISYYRKNSIHYINEMFYDKIYCSVIFKNSMGFIKGNAEFGGTGYSLNKKLSPIIESLEPDYSLYPDNDCSYGFISRECIRNCSFCLVPKKEGWIHQVSDINTIIKHKKVKFLDNNFLSLKNHTKILKELIDKKIKCSFIQGLDIRLINRINSELLNKLNYLGEYIFAFDSIKLINLIKKKLNLLSWRRDWQLKFYVYCNDKMDIKNILDRIYFLKENRCLPYLMRDRDCISKYKDLAAWYNQPAFFKNMDFDVFIGKRYK